MSEYYNISVTQRFIQFAKTMTIVYSLYGFSLYQNVMVKSHEKNNLENSRLKNQNLETLVRGHRVKY